MDWSLGAESLPRIVSVLKFLVLGMACMAVLMAVRAARRQDAPATGSKAARRLSPLFLMAFLSIAGYQATWQLTGFMRPEFVAFMRRYNRRPTARTAGSRGRILDRRGMVLATDGDTPGRRAYPQGRATCHVVGYSDPRWGTTGLERVDRASLTGTSLRSGGEWQRFARNVVDAKETRGNDLTVTLDARLQASATRLLQGRRGAVVGIRPDTGALLVLASAPTFDPNALESGLKASSSRAAPMFNRALQGLYPPGSVFKIAVAMMALDSGITGPYDCPADGYRPRGAPPIRDHEYYAAERDGHTWRGHGEMDLSRAFARSSNVFFARLGVDLGADRFRDMHKRLLFGQAFVVFDGSSGRLAATPSDLPLGGGVADRHLAQLSIGQGRLLVTPFHMGLLVAAIANDGSLAMPFLTPDQTGREPYTMMSPATARSLQRLMRGAIVLGTGRGAELPGVAVAGKTGTAQAPGGDDHSWFVCFAPVEKPALALAVVIEHGGYGAAAAVPVARELLAQADRLGLLRPARSDGGQR